jgi:hypothetical protein
MTNEILTKENLSTIATWLAIVLGALFNYFGITIGQAELTLFTTGLITLLIAIYSSIHPNKLTVLGNNENTQIEENQEEETCDEDEC